MFTYDQIFENNKRWLEEKKGTDANFFEKLGVVFPQVAEPLQLPVEKIT